MRPFNQSNRHHHNQPSFKRLPARFLVVLALLAGVVLPHTAAAQSEGTLVQNGNFENGASNWSLCGQAFIVDKQAPGTTDQMVYGGRYAARLYYKSDDRSCGTNYTSPYGAVLQQIRVPADATDLTISFWYSRVGDPIFPLDVYLGTSFLSNIDTENLEGWQLYRYGLSASQLQNARGKTLLLRIGTGLNVGGGTWQVVNSDKPGFYIDEVRVVADAERTGESPRPADLAGNGTRGIVYLDAALGGIARMDASGGNARKLINSSNAGPSNPVWSGRGDRIATISTGLAGFNTGDVTITPARLSIIHVVGSGGTGQREVYRTGGIPGKRPPAPTVTNPEQPAFDVEVYSIDWSPDDTMLALGVCGRNRSFDGSTTDAVCFIEIVSVASGKVVKKIEPGFRPNWGANNRIVYEHNDGYNQKSQGLYELDMNTNPPTETQLTFGTGWYLEASFFEDERPTWSPDGTRFATVRDVDGFHHDANGKAVFHDAIMLFERGNRIGRMLLLVDHGSSPSALTWSPDGKYLLYQLFRGNSADIWWLDVASGATGRLTTNGSSLTPDWRVRCPNAACRDATGVYLPLLRR